VILWLVLSFFCLLIVGIPVAVTMGLSSVIAIFNQDQVPVLIILQKVFGGMFSYPLLAIPFYMLAGQIMTDVGITQKLVNFANNIVGHVKGGLAYVNILGSLLFAGIQGSGTADCASLGVIEINSMLNAGYSKGYSCAVTAASACIGPIIPPSVMMIVYGSISGVSIGALFLAGVIPGFIMAFSMFIVCAFYAHKEEKIIVLKKFSLSRLIYSSKEAILALMMPFIIIFGIVGGIFTPTEAGVVAVVYAIFVGFFIYRTLTFRKLYKAVIKASLIVGMVGLILAFASTFNWILASEEIPNKVANYLLSLSLHRSIIFFLVILALYGVGSFMDIMASLIILVPILEPLGVKLGYNPIHWGLTIVLALCLGGITPPVGTHLFITTSIANGKLVETYKSIFPFYL